MKDLAPNRRGQISTVAGASRWHRNCDDEKGNRLGIATLDDRSGRLDLTLFGESLEQFGENYKRYSDCCFRAGEL